MVMDGVIFDIKEFAVHDGPGIRVTVFFKGCPLRCNWCHNPEGLAFEPELYIKAGECEECGKCKEPCTHEICQGYDRCLLACPKGLIQVVGKRIDATTLATQLAGYRTFLEMNGGGITISGGEPLAQPEFLVALLKELTGLHRAVETSGYGKPEHFGAMLQYADLILFDIKHMDTKVHKEYIGVDNHLIQQNLRILIDSGKPFIARIPLIMGVNDTQENFRATAEALRDATNLIGVEILPYNPFAGAKYTAVKKQFSPKFDLKRELNIDGSAFEALNIPYSVR